MYNNLQSAATWQESLQQYHTGNSLPDEIPERNMIYIILSVYLLTNEL